MTKTAEFFILFGCFLAFFLFVFLISYLSWKSEHEREEAAKEDFPECKDCKYVTERYPIIMRGHRLYSHCDDCLGPASPNQCLMEKKDE